MKQLMEKLGHILQSIRKSTLEEMIIDPNGEEFQLGRDLYDAHCIYTDLEAGKEIEKEKMLGTIKKYCRLINATGLLRAECNRRWDQ